MDTLAYEFGPYRLEVAGSVLLRDGTPVGLTPKAIAVLLLLVEQPGRVVSKEELFRRVWPDTHVNESNLTQTIFMLRKVLEAGSRTQYIENVPRIGYRFKAAVVRVPASAAEVSAGGEAVQLRRRGPLRPAFLAAALCAGILLATLWFGLRSHARASRVQTIAVLPLQNSSHDPDQDYLAEGITDALTSNLAQLRSLHVISRVSVDQAGSGSKSISQIARELHADAVLQGEVRRQGDRIHVAAQLTSPTTGTKLWSSVYDRDVRDLASVENDLARGVATGIGALSSSPAPARFADARAVAPEVHEAYLRGRYFWNKRTEAGYRDAIRQFQIAIAGDPTFAPAYSGLADAYALLGSAGASSIARPEAMERARAAAKQSLLLDDSEAEAHASLGFVLMHYDWDFAAAEQEFRHAIALNPNYATAHQWHAYNLAASGRIADSLAEIREAHRIDPLSLVIANDEGEMLLYARQFDKAIEQFQSILKMEPNFLLANLFLSDAYRFNGNAAAALTYARRSMQIDPASRWAQAVLACSLAYAGEHGRAEEIYRRMKTTPQTDSAAGMLALIAAAMGDKQHTRYWIERAYKERIGALMLLRVDPHWDPVREEAWFPRLAQLPSPSTLARN